MAHGFKTGGRKKGTPNKITKEVRESIQELVQSEISEIPDLIGKLEPHDRLSFLVKLLPYAIPKLLPEEPGNSQEVYSVEAFRDQFRDVNGIDEVKESYGGFIHQFKNADVE